VHAASEQPATNSQAFAEEFERLKSKVGKQSILLQELLRNKEPAETVQEPAETVQEPAERVGVLETPYYDVKYWKPFGPSDKETAIQEIGEEHIYGAWSDSTSWHMPWWVSIRSLPMRKLDDKDDEHGSAIFVGIEVCLADYRSRHPNNKPPELPFTIKKGGIMKLENIAPPFGRGSIPIRFRLESDVVGSLGNSSRLQCFWRVPMSAFTDRDGRRELLTLLPGKWRPDGYHRAEMYVKQYECQWRVNFELTWELGEAA
jgi:hypothetical protein